MQFTINLAAGQRARQQTRGAFFLLLSTGAAASVELWLMNGTEEVEYIRTAERGFKARLQGGSFSHVELRAAANTQAEIIISDNLVDFDFVSGTQVSATIAGPLPLPVSNDRGSPGNLMHVTAVTAADTPATSATNGGAVACGPVAAVVAAANANRRALRLCNLGPDPVAIGAAGITWAARCVVLLAGDVWVEDRGANLAWSAITDAGKTASVTAQGVNA